MIKVNNWEQLESVLSSLDCEEFIPIKIDKTTMDLFYDTKTDKFTLFEDSEYNFNTLEEMSDFIQFYYL